MAKLIEAVEDQSLKFAEIVVWDATIRCVIVSEAEVTVNVGSLTKPMLAMLRLLGDGDAVSREILSAILDDELARNIHGRENSNFVEVGVTIADVADAVGLETKFTEESSTVAEVAERSLLSDARNASGDIIGRRLIRNIEVARNIHTVRRNGGGDLLQVIIRNTP